MSQTYFTADLHFGHAAIINLAQRPFVSVEDMDETLIDRWNTIVRPEDTVWVLGDYALGNRAQGLSYLSRLAGRKMLVEGNHDTCWSGSPSGWKHQATYLAAGFSVVTPFARVKLPGATKASKALPVMLSHFPYDADHTDNARYTAYRLRDEGVPLVHGHVHQAYTVGTSDRGTTTVNVGVDRWDFAPVAARDVADLIRSHQETP